ncbi:MAG: DUF3667 domain-containing protein [Ignavibacteriales bacterium]|nr:DUF3667 domain-containing protein [Ignavibacteriales bacterium]
MKLNKSKHCLNCHQEINYSTYCPYCGQLNTDKKITLKQIVKDFLGDYFTFDSKFFRSITPLLFKPGHLTKEYIDGKRVNYILPLRLYIFTTFLFFFIVTLNTKLDFDKFSTSDFNSEKNIEKQDSTKDSNNNIAVFGNDSTTAKYSSPIKFTYDDSSESENGFSRYMNNKAKYLQSLGPDAKSLFVKELLNQLPKVMFFLLPIFALILKLIYIRKKMFYVEHLVFSLHIHTFIFVMLLFTAFISFDYFTLIIIVIITAYLFFSLRNFYEQSIAKTIVKFGLLTFLYMLVLFPAFGILAMLAFVSV